MEITENVVNSVTRELLGIAGPGGTDLEALHGWLLKFGDHSIKLRIIVEYFVKWLANQNPPWDSYQEFMSSCLLALNECEI